VPLLTRDDLRKQSPLAWASLAALAGVALWFWEIDKRNAAMGTLAALAGCLGLILPPRERMAVLPWRLRALPRPLDAAPVLGTILTSPGYGLNWFYGANPFDEVVHLFNGVLLGAIMGALLLADRRPRTTLRLLCLGFGFGVAVGVAWEVFEWATDLIGDWQDTWTDIVLGAFGSAFGAVAARAVSPPPAARPDPAAGRAPG